MKYSILLLTLFTNLLFIGCSTQQLSAPDSATIPLQNNSATTSAKASQYESQSKSNSDQISDVEIVQKDAIEMINAVFRDADAVAFLEYAPSQIIDMMGGESIAKSVLEGELSHIRKLNIKVDSITFPSPPIFLKTDENRFVVIPIYFITSSKGQRVESLSYHLGIQKKGTTYWKYVEGSRINNQNVRLLFPDFPMNYDFPEIYRKKL